MAEMDGWGLTLGSKLEMGAASRPGQAGPQKVGLVLWETPKPQSGCCCPDPYSQAGQKKQTQKTTTKNPSEIHNIVESDTHHKNKLQKHLKTTVHRTWFLGYLVCLSGSSDDSGESALGGDFGLHLGLELAGGAREGRETGQAQLKAG